jgi:exonuclease SbcD
MRFLHLSDLHIGKRVNEYSMTEDQRFILRQILGLAEDTRPDAVLIAGDLYDRSVPPGEAVGLLDDFLTELCARGVPVFAVSGNHDSPERLEFGSRIMRKNGVVLAGAFRGRPDEAVLSDRFGPVHLYLLPFLKPASAAPFFGDEADTTENAVRCALRACRIDPAERNVLVAHQFVTDRGRQPQRCDSETLSLGGSDEVDVSAFGAFDYVALGHLHGPQHIGRPEVRYAGSPLKYSFSEARQKKSVTLAELGEKGKIEITPLPLTPLHDMREIRGPIGALTRPEIAAQGPADDYIRAVLTDGGEVADAVGRLRAVYPNLMRIDFEAAGTPAAEDSRSAASGDLTHRTPEDLFTEFYRKQHGRELPEPERAELEKAVLAAEREDEEA